MLFEDLPPAPKGCRLKSYKAYLKTIETIKRSFERHEELLTEGGQDPLWPDGVNANLVRNHIIYDQAQAKEYAEAHGLSVPPVVTRAVPGAVPRDFEAPGSIEAGRAAKRQISRWGRR